MKAYFTASDEKLICEKYTKDTLADIIDDFINFVRGNNDTRFTFFITSEIASFLTFYPKILSLDKTNPDWNLGFDDRVKNRGAAFFVS